MQAETGVATAQMDRAIDQLVMRSRGPEHAAARLRTLMRACYSVSAELSLDAVLTEIVETARALSGAAYGALGVIADGGDGLERFVHVGMDASTVTSIGALPQGKGLLGALITDPRPLRASCIPEDPRSSGFPPNHPQMNSFLGVPISVRGEVFGNLYLANSVSGEFSGEDEEMVSALAVVAGTAIGNARIYHDAEVRQQWLTASVDIGEHLLANSGEDPLRTIARSALQIADADTVTLGLVADGSTNLLIEVAIGIGADGLIGRRFPLREVVGGLAVERAQPLRFSLADLPAHRTSTLAAVADAGPLMVLPLGSSGSVRGVLSLVRLRGRRSFSDSELAMAAAFANSASIALELSDARAAEQRTVLLEDRDRIARDLHDHVIQELFSIGMSLQGAAMTVRGQPEITERIQQRVDDIDRTIRRIRTAIFTLRGPLGANPSGLRERVLGITGELAPVLGFAPHVSFSGLVDLAVDPVMADDIDAVVREALTNAAKHAQARRIDVDLSVTVQDVVLTVSDNGVGLRDSHRRSGIANLRRRAEGHGGSMSVTHNGTGGTTLTWKAKT